MIRGAGGCFLVFGTAQNCLIAVEGGGKRIVAIGTGIFIVFPKRQGDGRKNKRERKKIRLQKDTM